MKGTLQGGIRIDISIERLVAAMSGLITVEQFFKTRKEAIPVVKLYGSLFLNCRETAVPLRTVLDSLP